MIGLVLLAQAVTAGLLFLVFGILRSVLTALEEGRHRHLADVAALVRIEKKLESIEVAIRKESDAIQAGLGVSTDTIKETVETEFRGVTNALRDAVHETPDFLVTGNDGEVPIRRMRSIRAQMAVLEERSRMAVEG